MKHCPRPDVIHKIMLKLLKSLQDKVIFNRLLSGRQRFFGRKSCFSWKFLRRCACLFDFQKRSFSFLIRKGKPDGLFQFSAEQFQCRGSVLSLFRDLPGFVWYEVSASLYKRNAVLGQRRQIRDCTGNTEIKVLTVFRILRQILGSSMNCFTSLYWWDN